MSTLILYYPRILSYGTVIARCSALRGRTWQQYWANAIDVLGPVTEVLGKVAQQIGTYLVVGVTERDTDFGGGTLYCTLLYFGPTGELLGKHSKFKPTAAERLI